MRLCPGAAAALSARLRPTKRHQTDDEDKNKGEIRTFIIL
jgi:hypothetical protein